jgi:hypothetical protein
MLLRTTSAKWIAAGLLGALIVAAGAAVAGDGDGDRDRPGRGRGWKARRARPALLDREARRHLRVKKVRAAKAMERIDALTDDQARAALDAAREIARIREEVRGKAAAVVLQSFREAKAAAPEARPAIREAARARMRALRDEARAPFTEAGMRVVRTLTPEQRGRIEEAAKARGRSVDDERLARFFGARLARPWARALLEAKLAGTPTAPK